MMFTLEDVAGLVCVLSLLAGLAILLWWDRNRWRRDP